MTCPLCHTVDTTLSGESFAAGIATTCPRCGQIWTAKRLETVAAYATYAAARAAVTSGPR
jgi:hypothetical protein